MKTQSAKNKGRSLQKWIRNSILSSFPELTERDVKSTSMGAQGEDIQLSSAAFAVFPFYVEAKSRAKIAVYPWFEQSVTEQDVLLVIKENRKRPLAVLDLEVFMRLLKENNDLKKNRKTS